MHYEQTIIQKCFALPESKYTFCHIIQGNINKYTLYIHVLLQQIVYKKYFNLQNISFAML